MNRSGKQFYLLIVFSLAIRKLATVAFIHTEHARNSELVQNSCGRCPSVQFIWPGLDAKIEAEIQLYVLRGICGQAGSFE